MSVNGTGFVLDALRLRATISESGCKGRWNALRIPPSDCDIIKRLAPFCRSREVECEGHSTLRRSFLALLLLRGALASCRPPRHP
jgi:hypothetical protein